MNHQKTAVPPHEFQELALRVAKGDFSLNASYKAKYEFTDNQKNTLNILLKLAKTKLFQNVTLVV